VALLLVGKGKAEEQDAFDKDIRDIKRMITDPRVMGIRSVFIFLSFCCHLCIRLGPYCCQCRRPLSCVVVFSAVRRFCTIRPSHSSTVLKWL